MLKFYKLNNSIIFDKKDLDLEKVEIKETDAGEKHVPQVTINQNIVEVVVGSNLHPMTPEHYIEYIVLETDKGYYVKITKDLKEARCKHCLENDEKLLAVYSYCNLHGVYKNTL